MGVEKPAPMPGDLAMLVPAALFVQDLHPKIASLLRVNADEISLSTLIDAEGPATLQVLLPKPDYQAAWHTAELPAAALVLCDERDSLRYFLLDDPYKALVRPCRLTDGQVLGLLPLAYGVGPEPAEYVLGGRDKALTAFLD